MKSIKRNILYLVGLICLGVSIIALIYMQSEHTKDYFSKLTGSAISVAITITVIQVFATWLAKFQRKGPVFFINRSEDDKSILDVIHMLQKGGCVCYPTSDLIPRTEKETLAAQIKASRLIVVLLTPGYEESTYMQDLLRIVKKEKRKNILFFTWDDDIPMPQSFKQSELIPLEGRDTDAEMMEYIIFERLAKF